ncbi:MAG: imidazolonepropionase-like amidohydrolase, partial [Candidatus Azotimanducaceae bacterium]
MREMNASAPNTVSGTAIEHVTIIDAENGLLKDMTVIFDDDRILQVLPADEAPKATVSIDGKGKYLIPGLWDMHVHLTYDDRFTDIMPATFLSYGITSVRDTGGLLKNILPVVARMRAPGAVAPRVFFSGPLLDGEHVVYDGNSRPEIGIRNEDVERAMQNVKALKANGADFIK